MGSIPITRSISLPVAIRRAGRKARVATPIVVNAQAEIIGAASGGVARPMERSSGFYYG